MVVVFFELVIELADEINPLMKFYMSEREAKQWCAKLNAIVNDNNEEYLIFPGAKHFYRLDLGSQAPQQEPLYMGAEKELFFSRITGLGPYEVWAADNGCTDEIFFGYPWHDCRSTRQEARGLGPEQHRRPRLGFSRRRGMEAPGLPGLRRGARSRPV